VAGRRRRATQRTHHYYTAPASAMACAAEKRACSTLFLLTCLALPPCLPALHHCYSPTALTSPHPHLPLPLPHLHTTTALATLHWDGGAKGMERTNNHGRRLGSGQTIPLTAARTYASLGAALGLAYSAIILSASIDRQCEPPASPITAAGEPAWQARAEGRSQRTPLRALHSRTAPAPRRLPARTTLPRASRTHTLPHLTSHLPLSYTTHATSHLHHARYLLPHTFPPTLPALTSERTSCHCLPPHLSTYLLLSSPPPATTCISPFLLLLSHHLTTCTTLGED